MARVEDTSVARTALPPFQGEDGAALATFEREVRRTGFEVAVASSGTAEAVARAGLRAVGENRVQEAKQKWPELRARFPDLKLHLIDSFRNNRFSSKLTWTSGISQDKFF